MTAPFGRRAAVVIERREVGAYVVLRVGDGGRAQPGQFYMLAACEGWGAGVGERPFLPRACSVLAADADELSFLLEDIGPGTRRLCALGAGDELWLTGPLGVGFRAAPGAGLIVGGGVGVAAVAMLEAELTGAGVLLGFRDAAHAAAGALFGAGAVIATDDGSVGHHGLVTGPLAAALDAAPTTVYACGPPAMLEAVRALCASLGVAAQLALEAPMACGFGACFGCVVATRDGYRRVCVDGPVFDAATLETVA